eukprot:scaffold7258_cov383-Prasinococcus_capsulatus_cf.AAC.7
MPALALRRGRTDPAAVVPQRIRGPAAVAAARGLHRRLPCSTCSQACQRTHSTASFSGGRLCARPVGAAPYMYGGHSRLVHVPRFQLGRAAVTGGAAEAPVSAAGLTSAASR